MTNISIRQALSVWSELEQAMRGEHGFGGHTAEVYGYRLSPCSPLLGVDSRLGREADREAAARAKDSLVGLLDCFREVHADASIVVDDLPLEQWRLEGDKLTHRCHVTICPESGRAPVDDGRTNDTFKQLGREIAAFEEKYGAQPSAMVIARFAVGELKAIAEDMFKQGGDFHDHPTSEVTRLFGIPAKVIDDDLWRYPDALWVLA